MGFRFSNRIALSKKIGINASLSGLSASYRGKYSSFGTRGFSIRTGIPGLTFRKAWSSSSSGKGLTALLVFLLSVIFVYVSYNIVVFILLIVYNIFSFVAAVIKHVFRFVRIEFLERKLRKHLLEEPDNPSRKFIGFSTDSYPERFKDVPYYLHEILIKSGEYASEGDEVCKLSFLDTSAPLISKTNGTITWYKLPGQRVFDGDYLASIIVDQTEVIPAEK